MGMATVGAAAVAMSDLVRLRRAGLEGREAALATAGLATGDDPLGAVLFERRQCSRRSHVSTVITTIASTVATRSATRRTWNSPAISRSNGFPRGRAT